jgi:hypothetical protein
MNFKHPTLVTYINYGYIIKVSIGIRDKIYEYNLEPTAWSLRLPERKRLTFRDVNKMIKWNKIL